MNWIRSRIRSGARLALLALAVQMVLSFGHMHRGDLGLPPLPAFGGTDLASDGSHGPAQPADREHHPGSDDYCAICASMVLIATAIPSLPPVLIVPETIHHLWPPQATLHQPATQIALSFQARAPPLV